MSWSSPSPNAVPVRPALDAVPVYSSALASSTPVTVRASSNEAPDGVSAAVRDAVSARLERPNRYPVLGGRDLIAAVAQWLGADPAEIAVADGSLSLLNYLLLAHCAPGAGVVLPWRSYEAYPICVLTAGGVPVRVPNRTDGAHDLDALASAIGEGTSAVLLCSPNNPTGVALTHDEIAAFLRHVPGHVLVVLDEAYRDFDDRADRPRSRELLSAHPNLVLLRTFSKAYGLAGMRVGYAVGHPGIITAVRKILPPFPVGALSVVAAIAALGDDAHREGIVGGVRTQRDEVVRMLADHRIPAFATASNFIWLPLGERSGVLEAICAEFGMSTRVFDGEGIRISLGEPGLVEALKAALERFASES
ncbi:aminotransferase class I/II-fold pyridoxal phosphate-dependent enzyme [Luethyella okanaganae]|uniref:Aminotransferase class I/II-fold pyridoxal phosphate-dependent enzyme n=1 Tax=Luethyella okanaganae TaxID=69372 RepID=A0ABW1VI12_9MICO